MIIETERLWLRQVRETDADAVHLYASDPEVCLYTDWGPNTWQDTAEFVAMAAAHPEGSLANLAITLKGDPVVVVGGVSAHTPRGEEPDERPHVREVGWVLRRDLWGQGIVTEALRGMIDHLLLTAPEVTRLEARCRPENARSERVMQRLGMTFQFHLDQDYRVREQWVDSVLYALDLRAPSGQQAEPAPN